MATSFPGALDAFSNPASGDLVTSPGHASQHTNINDAIEAVETKIGTGSSTPAAGTTLQGTGPGTSAWLPADYSTRVRKSGTQSISTATAVTWDTEDFDTDTMHDNVTNNTRITFTTAGKYLVIAAIMTDSNVVTETVIRLNGTTTISRDRGGNGNPQGYSTSTVYSFSAADYVEVVVTNSSAANVTTESHFEAIRLV